MKSINRKFGRNVTLHIILKLVLLIPNCSFLIFYFLSCQSAPKTTEINLDEAAFFPLDPGAAVYVYADVRSALPFINLNDKQLQQMVNQTSYAAAALYLPEMFPKVTLRYQLTAWGTYPASKAKMAFNASKEFAKIHSAISDKDYWHSSHGGLSLALTANRAYVSAAAWNIPNPPHDPYAALPGTAIPEGFNEFRKDSIIACWFEEPALILNKLLEKIEIPLEIPAEQLFISISVSDDQLCNACIRIAVGSPAQARALTTLFALARAFMLPDGAPSEAGFTSPADLASFLFASPPIQDDKYLIIQTNPFSAADIGELFKSSVF